METTLRTTGWRERLDRGGDALIVGFGRSGRAAAERLAERGWRLRVADATDVPAGPDASPGHLPGAAGIVSARFCDDDPTSLDGVALVVKSPGVSRAHPLIQAALSRSIPIIAELELGWALGAGRFISVTGSNGKSTTTALIAHVLATAGLDAHASGNIGEPLSHATSKASDRSVFVVEISSFQIEDLVDYETDVAVLLNVTPDHLDRHGTFDAYREIKGALLGRVRAGGVRVINVDDPASRGFVEAWTERDPAGTTLISTRGPVPRGAYLDGDDLVLALGDPTAVISRRALSIAGPHNVQNALAAMLAAALLGVPAVTLSEALATFEPLPHRLEPVGALGAVRFVNDSKATNLDSLRVALASFPDPVVLIAGGRDKGSPFEDVLSDVRARTTHVVLIGEAQDRIASAWAGVSLSRAASLDAAVREAYARARPAGVVLLAPGCTSFDMFTSFAHRGDAFREVVARLIEDERHG